MPTEIMGRFKRDEDCCGESLSHPNYRLLVMKKALSLGRRPGTSEMFAAKRAVDRQLGVAGVGIKIPGAYPGRRTI
jgi:hypothetical protein